MQASSITIFRHGETVPNIENVFQGHLNGDLSEKGRSQADALGEYFADRVIHTIISSDLDRAKETAQRIQHFHPLTPIEYNPDLRERNFGIYEGRSLPSFDSYDSVLDALQEIESVEGEDELIERTKKFLESIQDLRGNIFLSTHGGTSIFLISLLLDIPIREVEKQFGFPSNTAFSILNRKNNEWEIETINATDHLYAENQKQSVA
jgi:broad specificity phosphatase PhoE